MGSPGKRQTEERGGGKANEPARELYAQHVFFFNTKLTRSFN